MAPEGSALVAMSAAMSCGQLHRLKGMQQKRKPAGREILFFHGNVCSKSFLLGSRGLEGKLVLWTNPRLRPSRRKMVAYCWGTSSPGSESIDQLESEKKSNEEPAMEINTSNGTSSDESHSFTTTASVEDDKPKSWFDRIPKRWQIVALCFFAFLLCNMDRVNMSIAILPMASEFHWNSTTVGLVQSSFFWGYLLTQIAGGVWADSIGGKKVLGFGVIWWSVATVLTPLAAKLGLPVLFAVRACMGIGEGVAMPAMNNLLSRWIPVTERSRSLALVYSGMYLGSVTGLAFSPALIHKYNWPSVFFTFGSLGAVWFTFWQKNAYSSPAEDLTLSEEEKNYILGDSAQEKVAIGEIPWGQLLSEPSVWALIVCHFCHNWGTFILLTWMPTYYNQVLGFNLMESGMFSVLPWLTMALSSNLGGWIADNLVKRGVSVTLVRKVMQSIGFLGPAFFLTQLSHIRSPSGAVLCMMASQGLDAFSQSGLYSNHQDIGPRYAGVLLGLSNTAGVLAGVIGTAATGYILQHGTWDDVFKVAVALYLVGTVVWNLFSTGERVID
ncbi:sodium-dependent phosphate transport protein 1, chloroplastic [Selaginella moellendorffii]|nr:sodium-dependent phosphate transport protein 1, chloroplastic [Selaginella moellendorffii]|eukprot:XP_002979008.2 sodium-dependent phosphate transport protein 1, chloroplastic [Selaginella moellendorffii]